jgi:energy-converting hydrogenase Eha subunit H
LTLASGGGLNCRYMLVAAVSQASKFPASLGHSAAVLVTAGITAGRVFCGGFVWFAAVLTAIFIKNIGIIAAVSNRLKKVKCFKKKSQ